MVENRAENTKLVANLWSQIDGCPSWSGVNDFNRKVFWRGNYNYRKTSHKTAPTSGFVYNDLFISSDDELLYKVESTK